MPRITVDEPTVSMRIFPNNSPLAGTEGSLVQSTRIHERLQKETLRNVAIRLEVSPERDCFIIKGRGEFQLAILIETMRREGFELCVGRPEVIFEYKDGAVVSPSSTSSSTATKIIWASSPRNFPSGKAG